MPAATLSANLVAIKGMATPAPDMPSRAAPSVAAVPPAAAPPSDRRSATAVNDGEGREASLTPLNFRIPASFRREFKTYAAKHDLKLNELLRRCFDAYRREKGD
jgi:hypothetical protein